MEPFRHPNERLKTQADEHHAEISALALLALRGEIAQDQFEYQLSQIVIAAYMTAFLLGGGDVNEWESDEVRAQRAAGLRSVYTLSDDIYNGEYSEKAGTRTAEDGMNKLINRLLLWSYTLGSLYALGQLFPRLRVVAGELVEPNYVWRRGGTKEPCSDCLRLDGVVMSAAEWRASGYRPQDSALECGGWNCLCYLEPTVAESNAAEVIGWTEA